MPSRNRILFAGAAAQASRAQRTSSAASRAWSCVSAMTTATWSPTHPGSRIVTGSIDQTAKVWDAKTGAEVLTLKGHTKGVLAASFSPDGSRVVTASMDGTARLWDAKTGQLQRILYGHSAALWNCGWSPNGRRVFSTSTDDTFSPPRRMTSRLRSTK